MNPALQNKTILVIGGAKRIGRAVALECARIGANVAFTFHTSKVEAEETLSLLCDLAPERRFAAFPLDVSRSDSWREVADLVEGEFGPVFGMVFCAAIFERTPLETLREDDLDRHLATNTKGPYLGCLTWGERLSEGGSIVLFSDIYASKPLANYIPYCVSKAGVEMVAKGFAKALAPRVRVNCLAPGAILPGENDEDGVDVLVARVPIGRLGRVEEVAAAVVFLLGDGSFISGAVLPLDGGQLLR